MRNSNINLYTRGAVSQSVTLHEEPLPSLVQAGATVELGCSFHLDTNNTSSSSSQLYSVKWYRDNVEFFRYIPSEDPHTTVFIMPGRH